MAISYNDYQSGYSGVTAEDVGDMIGITPTAKEILVLDKIIERIELFVCNYCNRQFKTEALAVDEIYEEIVLGSGVKYYLGAYPIKEIERINYDGEDIYVKDGVDNKLKADDFVVMDDFIVFNARYAGDYFASDLYFFHNKKMLFENTIKPFWGTDLVMIIEDLAGQRFQGRDTGNKDLTSVSTGTYSVSYADTMSEAIKTTLNKYKKVLI